MTDDDKRRRHERPNSIMGDDQRAKIGAGHRKTPAAGSSVPQVYEETENSEVYGGAELENIRKRAEIRDRRDTKERVAKLEVHMDGARQDISEVKKDVGEMKGSLEKVLVSNAQVTTAFDMYIKMNPPRPPEPPRTTETSITEVVRKTVTDQTQTTLAALVLEREGKREDREARHLERKAERKGKFWDSVWLKVVGGIFGGAGGALLVKYLLTGGLGK